MDRNDTGRRRLCVLLTCFNRCEKTLACLARLERNRTALTLHGWQVDAVLVDDGSTDGTAQAVRGRYPWVEVLRSTQPLYWSRGMRLAQQQPLARAAEAQLWLNDDVLLDDHALPALLDCLEAVAPGVDAGEACAIVVGSTRDAVTGATSYGAQRVVSGWRRTSFVGVEPTDSPQRCDVMNGNIVLVPRRAAQRVGDIDATFEHAMGDTDYSLRAGLLGVPVWLAPGHLGSCSNNPVEQTYRDRRLPWRRRWRLMMDRKGLPWRSWLHLTRRHTGVLWPVYFLWPYAKLVLQGLCRR